MTLKAGLEIHQQLNSGKLFCNCDINDSGKNLLFNRKLHATSSEMGEIDVAAKTEQIQLFTYYNKSCNCLIYADEEPPRGPNEDAVRIALQFAKLVGAKVVEEVYFMRKVVVDGSNTSGFQRTGLIATGGKIEYDGKIFQLDNLTFNTAHSRLWVWKYDKEISSFGLDYLTSAKINWGFRGQAGPTIVHQ